MENDLQEHEGMDTCEEKGKKKGENQFCISTQKKDMYYEQCKNDGHEKDHYWTLHHKLIPRTLTRTKLLKFHKVEGYKIEGA